MVKYSRYTTYIMGVRARLSSTALLSRGADAAEPKNSAANLGYRGAGRSCWLRSAGPAAGMYPPRKIATEIIVERLYRSYVIDDGSGSQEGEVQWRTCTERVGNSQVPRVEAHNSEIYGTIPSSL